MHSPAYEILIIKSTIVRTKINVAIVPFFCRSKAHSEDVGNRHVYCAIGKNRGVVAEGNGARGAACGQIRLVGDDVNRPGVGIRSIQVR